MAWKPNYIDASDVASYLRVTDSVDDVEFGRWATAASRAVDKRCNRQFGQVSAASVRTYRRQAYYVQSLGLWLVDIDDVQDVTGLLVGGTAYASSGALLLPETAPDEGHPYTALGFSSYPGQTGGFMGGPGWLGFYNDPIIVTAKWGWTAVPDQVIAAALLQCARWNVRRDSPYGIAGSPEQGSEMRLLSRLDPDVATTLAGLIRPRRAA